MELIETEKEQIVKKVIPAFLSCLILLLVSSSFAEVTMFVQGNTWPSHGVGIQFSGENFGLEGIAYPDADDLEATSDFGPSAMAHAEYESDGFSVNIFYLFDSKERQSFYLGAGYMYFSGELTGFAYTNSGVPATASGSIESEWAYINTFGGYRFGGKYLFLDTRVGIGIGLYYESPPTVITGSGGGVTIDYTTPGYEGDPENQFYASVSLGLRF